MSLIPRDVRHLMAGLQSRRSVTDDPHPETPATTGAPAGAGPVAAGPDPLPGPLLPDAATVLGDMAAFVSDRTARHATDPVAARVETWAGVLGTDLQWAEDLTRAAHAVAAATAERWVGQAGPRMSFALRDLEAVLTRRNANPAGG